MARVGSGEVMGWSIFERMYGPLGPERLDYLAASVQATIANVNRRKGARPYKPAHFAPKWVDVKRWPWSDAEHEGPMTPEQMLRQVKQINASMGGREATGEGRQGGDAGKPAHQDRGRLEGGEERR